MGRAVVGVQFRRQRAMDRSQLHDRPEDEREAPDQSGKEDAEGGGAAEQRSPGPSSEPMSELLDRSLLVGAEPLYLIEEPGLG